MTAIWKKKPALLLTVGTAIGLIAGGATAWWIIQQRTPITGLPAGANVLPQDTAISFSVSTDAGQWRQLRQYGTPQTQASFDQTLVTWRDRLFTENGFSYSQDIQPWVGDEITVAFLNPPDPSEEQSDAQIQPYQLPNQAEVERTAVTVLPIANPDRAQQFWADPTVTESQQWADRDYKGVKIREVHGQTELDYAAAMLDDRFVVVSGDAKAIERVIDTFKGDSSVAQVSGYGQAFKQLEEAEEIPFMRLYVNVPEATEFTVTNASQPLPPHVLMLLQNNQGLASVMTLESQGIRFQGLSWIASDSQVRLNVENSADRAPSLLPSDTVMMASGGNFKEFWENYSQPTESQATPSPQTPPRGGFLNPDLIRQAFNNFTGLDLDKDLIAWMDGEFTIGLLSSPPSANATQSTAGVVIMVQTNDRRAADEGLKNLDDALNQRGWQIQETKLNDQSVVNWVSPFAALTITRGWLDGNIAFLAIGPNVANAVFPTPVQPLIDNETFRQAISPDLAPNNGHFFISVDRLANPETNLPLPNLPQNNRDALNAIRAIGVTTAIQDNRTTRYDVHVLLRRSDKAPEALPVPGEPVKPAASPEATPSPSSPEAPPEVSP
ncbi:MAG: DUF3352 domain-containing protein [Cyanobacteria bacterium RU_5_0]|nr:DUF3352 domain-containing protein [Cyanobacteria bacterium RU_5_0]